MFSRVVKQGIISCRLTKSIKLYNLCPSAIRLCNYLQLSNFENQRKFSVSSPIVILSTRKYSDGKNDLTEAQFIDVCEETLQSLYERFEELADKYLSNNRDVDIMYEGGILKIELGSHGTYVINRQTPNKQIWLSSPLSGPKRYDFVNEGDKNGHWLYKHDGVTLHKLLKTEITKILSKDVDFSKCSFCKL